MAHVAYTFNLLPLYLHGVGVGGFRTAIARLSLCLLGWVNLALLLHDLGKFR